jgi:hypothetical protein
MFSSSIEQVSNAIYTYLRDRKDRKNVNLEVEARFGSVSRETFFRIISYVEEQLGSKIEPVNSIDKIYVNEVRSTQELNQDLVPKGKMTWIEKKSVPEVKTKIFTAVEFLKGIGIKLTANEEIKSVPSATDLKLTRKKKRYTADLGEGDNADIRFDASQIITEEKGNSAFSYELELEVLGLVPGLTKQEIEDKITALFNSIELFWKEIQNSTIPVEFSEYNEIRNYLLRLFGVKTPAGIFKSLPRPKDLTVYDLTLTEEEKLTPSVIADKTDGETRLLLLYTALVNGDKVSGIYLIDPRFNINKVIEFRKSLRDEPVLLFEGELTKPKIFEPLSGSREEKNPDGKFGINKKLYVIYELLATDKGLLSKNVNLSLEQRLSNPLIPEFINTIRRTDEEENKFDLGILLKKIYPYSTVPEFYSQMNACLDSLDNLPYPTDEGIIITPNFVPHIKFADEEVNKKKHIKRWKKLKNMTIDFQISQNFTPLSADETLEGDYEFKEFSALGFDVKKQFDPKGFQPGEIVEFEYRDGKLIARKARPDKIVPNSLFVAREVWKLIQLPISENTLRGIDLALMRKYHNTVKKRLLEKLPKGSTLFDIGGGGGGDIKKWQDLQLKVVSTEPDQKNREEFTRRVGINKFKVDVLPFGGQDTKEIREAVGDRKFDAISLMLSLSFFFQSSNLLDGLCETISTLLKDKGKLLITTINGDPVKEFMRGEKEKIKASSYSLILNRKDRELKIDIPGTIVEEQTEWLVDLTEFKVRLKRVGIELLSPSPLTEEKFLSSDELLLTSFYSAVIGVRNYTPIKTPPKIVQVDFKNLARDSSAVSVTTCLPEGRVRFLSSSLSNNTIRRGIPKGPDSLVIAFLIALIPDYRYLSSADLEAKAKSYLASVELSETKDSLLKCLELASELDVDVYLLEGDKLVTPSANLLRRISLIIRKVGDCFELVGLLRDHACQREGKELAYVADYTFEWNHPVIEKLYSRAH